MKKVLFLFFVSAFVLVGSSNAQFKFGAGLALNSKAAFNDNLEETVGFGLNLRGTYLINNLGFSLGNTAYLPSKVSMDLMGESMEMSMFLDQINLDVMYKFVNVNDFSLYGLAGPVLSIASAKASLLGESAVETTTEVGVGLGLGTNYKKLFGELKYETYTKGIVLKVGFNF